MFTSLRFLCFGNTPLPSLNSPQRAQSIESTPSPLRIDEESATQSASNSDSNNLTLSSSIGPYPIPSSLMREVESIRAHILQQKGRHQKQQSRRHKQKSRRQRLQQTTAQSTAPHTHYQTKPTPISYNDVSSPYAEDTSVFELNLAGENTGDESRSTSLILHDADDQTPEYGYFAPEEQTWDAEVDRSSYLELDDFISQGYLETCDNLVVCNPPQKTNVQELYPMSQEMRADHSFKHSNGDTGWWLVKHIDPKALSKLGNDCVIL
ncbi:hypothetical protein TWF281_005704 [Arthrobotrys megalospora]